MKRPIFVRVLSDDEREDLVASLRSSDAFVMRRCQILLASSRGKIAREIAADLGCDGQTVRTAINAFNTKGRECLAHWSSRPHTIRPAFDAEQAARLRALRLVWDNASWHISHTVRAWIRTHNRQVKQEKKGVREIVEPALAHRPRDRGSRLRGPRLFPRRSPVHFREGYLIMH